MRQRLPDIRELRKEYGLTPFKIWFGCVGNLFKPLGWLYIELYHRQSVKALRKAEREYISTLRHEAIHCGFWQEPLYRLERGV